MGATTVVGERLDLETGAYDLVMIAVPGVQRFIDEARSTLDARAASEIVARLAAEGARGCLGASPEAFLVFPSGLAEQGGTLVSEAVDAATGDMAGAAGGVGSAATVPKGPNRIVVVAPPGHGKRVARGAVAAIEDEWKRMLRATFELAEGGEVPQTPGMPTVVWVCVAAGDGGDYADRWARAQAAMAARRRLRDFSALEVADLQLCDLSPRWAAAKDVPPGLRERETARLAPANWVKRRWRHVQDMVGFPSTPSIASAPYRREVLDRLNDSEVARRVSALRAAVRKISRVAEARVPGLVTPSGDLERWLVGSGGPWVYPDRWQAERIARDNGGDLTQIQSAAEQGRRAAKSLAEFMAQHHGIRPPTDYLAVIVQDLDGMGLFLSGRRSAADGTRLVPDARVHQEVSARLGMLATDQADRLGQRDLLGVPVYAGGDDLLGFAPAGTALAAARACRDLLPAGLPTASTAVVFFHHSHSLRDALGSARALLEDAKDKVYRKNALGVAYMRRSGVTASSVQPWQDRTGVNAQERFAVFAADAEHPLSPRLLTDLERDQAELARLWRADPMRFRAELARLVTRHTGGDHQGAAASAQAAADQMVALGAGEALRPAEVPEEAPFPVPAVRIAAFLRQEAWPYPGREGGKR